MAEQHGVFKEFKPELEKGETLGIVDDANKISKLVADGTIPEGASGEEAKEILQDHLDNDEK